MQSHHLFWLISLANHNKSVVPLQVGTHERAFERKDTECLIALHPIHQLLDCNQVRVQMKQERWPTKNSWTSRQSVDIIFSATPTQTPLVVPELAENKLNCPEVFTCFDCKSDQLLDGCVYSVLHLASSSSSVPRTTRKATTLSATLKLIRRDGRLNVLGCYTTGRSVWAKEQNRWMSILNRRPPN